MKKSDAVKMERDKLLLAGEAGRTELLRRVHAAADGGHDDSPIYQEEVRRLRYSQGGLHDRLKEAAARQVTHNTTPRHRDMMRAFVGFRQLNFIRKSSGERGYAYET